MIPRCQKREKGVKRRYPPRVGAVGNRFLPAADQVTVNGCQFDGVEIGYVFVFEMAQEKANVALVSGSRVVGQSSFRNKVEQETFKQGAELFGRGG